MIIMIIMIIMIMIRGGNKPTSGGGDFSGKTEFRQNLAASSTITQ